MLDDTYVNLFQFHKGTIKTADKAYKETLNSYFNSIKVRLKPDWRAKSVTTVASFQFHKGTIKTPLSLRHTPPKTL